MLPWLLFLATQYRGWMEFWPDPEHLICCPSATNSDLHHEYSFYSHFQSRGNNKTNQEKVTNQVIPDPDRIQAEIFDPENSDFLANCKRSVPTISRCMTDILLGELSLLQEFSEQRLKDYESHIKACVFWIREGRASILPPCGFVGCAGRGEQNSGTLEQVRHSRGCCTTKAGTSRVSCRLHGMLQKPLASQCLLTPIFPGWQKRQLKIPLKAAIWKCGSFLYGLEPSLFPSKSLSARTEIVL